MKNNHKFLCIGVVGTVLLAGSGCGLILSGTHETIPIDSEPQRAEVWLDGVSVGRTPLGVEVDSTQEHVITIKQKGMKEQQVRIDRSLPAGYILLDFFFPGLLIGALVDGLSGGWYVSTPETVSVELSPAEISQKENRP